MFNNSKWIWAENNAKLNDWVKFKKEIEIKVLPTSAIIKVAADNKYYLWINNKMVIFEGNLNREANTCNGYFDEIDIAEFLVVGENIIEILVWFWGNGGRNNTRIKKSGLIFECNELNLFSDNSWQVMRCPEQYAPDGQQPSYLYGGYNIGWNSNNFNNSFTFATEVANYLDMPFGILTKRPIPLLKFYDITIAEYINIEEDQYEIILPYGMQVTPYIKVIGNGDEIIDIRSDHYVVSGGPGDDNHYYGHRTEYICKFGEQEFESLDWVYCEKLIFKIPKTVTIISLGYRKSEYPTEIKKIKTNNKKLNILLDKCSLTLKVCMRDNFMDCPDRERGQWIGDVSAQAPQVFYALDTNAVLLLKKAIYDFINLRKGDVLVGNVPGEHSGELPSQSLNAISELGMIAEYYRNTGDLEVIKLAFEPCINYLKLWKIESDGFISKREGGWYWFDHLYNIDEKVLENEWYYSALKFAKIMSKLLCDTKFDEFINERIKSIEDNFDKTFWNGKYYSSGKVVDDRANAMAVLSGLASKDKFLEIRKVMLSVFSSTTYMENYALDALCFMGYKQDAYKRMMSRYYNLIENDSSTLWEDFFLLGTKNHAWSGAPLTIICKYFKELLI